ncbi:MAG: hypothetical protein H7315_11170 [Herminiimonas sp.]|nr:hypothetical protein [Herminiimonas sp.]
MQPAVQALIDEKLRRAFGFEKPAAWLCGSLSAVLRIRRHLKRFIHLEPMPKLIANTHNRTYPGNRYTIDAIAPSYMKERK